MAAEPSRIAPAGDGMKVKRKGVGLEKEHAAEEANPIRQQGAMLLASGPVGVVGSVRLPHLSGVKLRGYGRKVLT